MTWNASAKATATYRRLIEACDEFKFDITRTFIVGKRMYTFEPDYVTHDDDIVHYHPIIGEAIAKICAAVGARSWEELKNKVVCVTRDRESGMIVSVEAPPFVPHGPAYNIKEHLGQKIDY